MRVLPPPSRHECHEASLDHSVAVLYVYGSSCSPSASRRRSRLKPIRPGCFGSAVVRLFAQRSSKSSASEGRTGKRFIARKIGAPASSEELNSGCSINVASQSSGAGDSGSAAAAESASAVSSSRNSERAFFASLASLYHVIAM